MGLIRTILILVVIGLVAYGGYAIYRDVRARRQASVEAFS